MMSYSNYIDIVIDDVILISHHSYISLTDDMILYL